MPGYVVVVCPNCKNAFIIEPGTKIVSCRSCNKRLESSSLKIFFKSDDFKEAQTARGSIMASISGDSKSFEAMATDADRNVMQRIGEEDRFLEDKARVEEMMKKEAAQTRKKGQQAILRDTFEELSENGDVSVETYWEKVSYSGIDRKKFDEWVDRMIETGTAFSPRHGTIRKC